MNSSKGYIYVRRHECWDIDDVCKLGKSANLPDRDSTYITGEFKRGYFVLVFEVSREEVDDIEIKLQNHFIKLHVKNNGGNEFFKKDIIPLIEPYLISNGIKYKKLTKQEINNLTRGFRIRKTTNKIKIKALIRSLKSKRTNKPVVSYTPRDDQTIIVENAVIHIQQYDKGILVLICGIGKTLISLWITQKLNSNTILIGVPNKLLLDQWNKVIGDLFPSIPCKRVDGNVNTENITQFLENNKKCIVITTYHSSYKVFDATQKIGFKFEMKILDEVHHLTTNNLETEGNTYVKMLKIKSKKQLSLTATLKILENQENKRDEDIVVSNDNVEQFGEIIDRKGLLWAIDNNIICDYVIQTPKSEEEKLEQYLEQFRITDENDKRLFLSAYISLKSINDGHSHHLLIYSNSKRNSLKLTEYIEQLLKDGYFELPNLYYSNYHSEMNTKKQTDIINKFENSKCGIITCVYCLGEGWDFPLLDGVVFAENMTSPIRILQSTLRAFRIDINDIHKKTKIIVPILDRDDWLESNDNPDMKKLSEVIYQMGLEDETIEHKIKVSNIEISRQNPKQRENVESVRFEDFGEYNPELTQKIQLRTRKRTALSTTYEKARKIIADKNIKSQENYYELCDRDNRLSKDPEKTFNVQFTNWIEYLSIPKCDYYDLEMCKQKASECLLEDPELKKYHMDLAHISNVMCSKDTLFPPKGLWVEFYGVKNLQDIIIISNKKKRTGVR